MSICKRYIALPFFIFYYSTYLYAQSTNFYIASIIDQRENKSNLGQILNANQAIIPLKLSESLSQLVAKTWHITPSKTPESYPIIVKITALKISESLAKNERITGKFNLTMSFSWLRDSTDVMLTPYRGGIQFTRSLNKNLDYEIIVANFLGNAMQYFKEWMKQNLDKNPALARGVRVVVQPHYTRNTPESDTVFHAERPLKWTDFLEKKTSPNNLKPFNSRFVASIYSTFLYEAPAHFRNGYIEIELRLKVFMQKSMSWLLPEAQNAYALNHEQLHFDITRLVAERFKSHILAQNLSVEDYDSQLQLAYIDFYREMNKLQDQYDAETEHGLDKAAQAQWQQRIAKQLMIYE